MPNWVFNNVGNYSKDLLDKYGTVEGEDDKDPLYLDFNKVIPEPEEITKTISGSVNDEAKRVAAYKDWKSMAEHPSKYDSPIYKSLHDQADNTAQVIGYKAIENPDKSLNQIVSEEDNKYIASRYNNYTSLFGNKEFNKLSNEEFLESCDKYCYNANERFKDSKNSKFNEGVLDDYDTIEDYGKHLNYLKEKYGYDNWYDWRNSNWGTKWNGCDQEYDPETEQLKFDTAWCVPEPIFAKIAEDNPDKNLDIYSEEETGWFIEGKTENGQYIETASGEITYNEETDSTETTKEEYDTPRVVKYKEVVEANKAFNESISKSISNVLGNS